MSPVASETSLTIIEHAPIATWFGVGGGARRLATPESVEQVRECIELDRSLRVLGDGANLLVDDDAHSTTRKPMWKSLWSGVALLAWYAERQCQGRLNQLPPRRTRLAPPIGPVGSDSGLLP